MSKPRFRVCPMNRSGKCRPALKSSFWNPKASLLSPTVFCEMSYHGALMGSIITTAILTRKARWLPPALFFFGFFRPHSRHVEIPRLEIKREQVYTTATATPDPRCICKLHHSSWQCHWACPGIEPTTSWLLVGFVSTAPQWELPVLPLFLTCVKFSPITSPHPYQSWFA